MTRKALGKGLEALFGNMGTEMVNPKTGSTVHEVELGKITPNPFQPRREFNPEEIRDLANSIREKGLLQPIVLRKHGEGYQIVAGERRYRATKLLEKATVLALIREQVSDRDMMELALIENIQRVQLNPVEEAEALDNLINNCGITHEELAQKLGKSRSAVTNTLRLLKLEAPVQTLLREGKLTAGHGRALLGVEGQKQVAMANKIIAEELNVRSAEKSTPAAKKKDAAPVKGNSPNVNAFVEKIRYILGTKVLLKGTENQGVLEIHYMNRQELEAIGSLLQKGHESQS